MNFLILWDKQIFDWIVMVGGNPQLQAFCEAIAKPKYLLSIAFIYWLFYFKIHKKGALLLLAAVVFNLAFGDFMVNFLKYAVGRPRPGVVLGLYYNPAAFAWPSAHAFNSMSFAILIYLWSLRRITIFIFFSFLIGMARVISNYHFPLDVISGWILGTFWAYLQYHVGQWFVEKR
ncbi:MAG: phosphatase PAP2 family protein [Candidatus Hydrogenedentota bacterium]|nr:MAG: phosphatase PAP2 family protein [Candidatus Hydrogenedentota bacterium]